MVTMLRQFLICLSIFVLGGCAVTAHYQELVTLKKLNASQKEIEKDLSRQEALFAKLRKDLKNNKLKETMPQKRILEVYGEPVLSKRVESDQLIKEVFLYRHPTDFFSSDRIYLYFNYNEELVSWELKAGSGEEETAK